MAFGALKYKDNTGVVLPSADAFCPHVWCKKLQVILLVHKANFSSARCRGYGLRPPEYLDCCNLKQTVVQLLNAVCIPIDKLMPLR